MLATIASCITLSAFIIPIAFLIFRLPQRRKGDMVLQALHGALMGLGGLIFSSLFIRLLSIESAPVLTSVLVVIGSLACLVVYCLFFESPKNVSPPSAQGS